MIVISEIPITIEERLALGESALLFPAPWEQYISLLDQVEYTLEYHNENIVALSYASEIHEEMVARLIYLIQQSCFDTSLRVLASNHRVHLPEQVSNFAPDLIVVDGTSDRKMLGPKKSAILNPYLVVEILSTGTRNYDLGTKLPTYKQMPALDYILYIDSEEIAATLHHRDSKTSLWRSTDYDATHDTIRIGEVEIILSQVYPQAF